MRTDSWPSPLPFPRPSWPPWSPWTRPQPTTGTKSLGNPDPWAPQGPSYDPGSSNPSPLTWGPHHLNSWKYVRLDLLKKLTKTVGRGPGKDATAHWPTRWPPGIRGPATQPCPWTSALPTSQHPHVHCGSCFKNTPWQSQCGDLGAVWVSEPQEDLSLNSKVQRAGERWSCPAETQTNLRGKLGGCLLLSLPGKLPRVWT